jgi:hypothetical protein
LSRADAMPSSPFYVGKLVTVCQQAGVAVSVTINHYLSVVAAIAGAKKSAWVPIRYPTAAWDEQTQAWISDADTTEALFLRSGLATGVRREPTQPLRTSRNRMPTAMSDGLSPRVGSKPLATARRGASVSRPLRRGMS